MARSVLIVAAMVQACQVRRFYAALMLIRQQQTSGWPEVSINPLFALSCCLALSSACGSSSGDNDIDPPVGRGDGLVLDYTAFVDGAVQVSGVGVNRTTGVVVVVTDFEQVVLVDPDSISAISTFSAQLGALPRQGSTEAVAFTSAGDIAVLYPDVPLLRIYDDQGIIVDEASLDQITRPLHGAMALSADGSKIFLIGGESTFELFEVELPTGDIVRTVAIDSDIDTEISGLSPGADGSDRRLWAVTEDSRAFEIEVNTGRTELMGTLSEVEDCSGSEAFVGPDDEPVLAVSDDADRYNDQPGPIRLYLLND